jgi:integrase
VPVWDFESIKSKKHIKLPLAGFSEPARLILEKYSYKLPKISEPKFNKYIKEVAAIAGLNREVVIKRYAGNKPVEIRKPLHEFISSHAGRRTFVTLLMEKGVPNTTLMKMTGHSDLRTLMKYENTGQDAVLKGLEFAGSII